MWLFIYVFFCKVIILILHYKNYKIYYPPTTFVIDILVRWFKGFREFVVIWNGFSEIKIYVL
nr:MAG TPA: Prospero homeobox protein [Crassvirales sp.]